MKQFNFQLQQLKWKYFLHHQINDYRKEAHLKCWNRYQLKYSDQYFEVFWTGLVFHLKTMTMKCHLGQWRRKRTVVSKVSQLQIGFNLSWRLYLNLKDRRWLNASLSLIINFKSLGLCYWKVLFAERFVKGNTNLPQFLTFESKLFHSIKIEMKKVFLK